MSFYYDLFACPPRNLVICISCRLFGIIRLHQFAVDRHGISFAPLYYYGCQ